MNSSLPAMTLPEAPGAKTARVCGILAIVFAITCIGIPVSIVLGIVALVKHSSAKKAARDYPETYSQPSQTGLVTGIIGLVMPVIMLPFAGIVSAIAIPAMLGQRNRAKDRVAIVTMRSKLPELVERYGRAQESGADAMSVKTDLEACLQSSAAEKNPYNPQSPAYRFTIGMTPAASEEDMTAAARAQATAPGEVVFVMSAPVDPQAPRFVAGAVRTQMPVEGSLVTVKVVRVD